MEIDNLRILSNQAMVAATAAWVSPGEAQTAMRAIPELAGYMDRMADAYQGLLRIQVTGDLGPEQAALKEIAATGAALDADYDRLARGVSMVLEANALVALDNPEAEKALAVLRAKLFPAGMTVIQQTYLEESGEVTLARERLTDEDRDGLARVPTVSGTALDAVETWFGKGDALGELEEARARALSAAKNAATVSPRDVVVARNYWIRVVRAILTGLDLAEDVSEDTRVLILQPLEAAVIKAMARSSRPATPPVDTPAETIETPTEEIETPVDAVAAPTEAR